VEVLVVNDGSKDRSSEIAHSYADRYPQSIKVIDKSNGNYGSCINAALPVAIGRYVKVLDADDSFDTTAFSEFVRQLPSLTDDVLITPYDRVDELGTVLRRIKNDYHKFIKEDITYTFEQAYKRKYIKPYIEMHALTYKKDIFCRFNYRQTEGISFTDTEWATFPFAHAKTIRFVCIKPIYKYLIGREGQTMDSSRFRSQLDNYFVMFDKDIEMLKSFEGNIMGRDFALNRVMFRINLLCMWARTSSDEVNAKIIRYDNSLIEKSPELYNALANFEYLPGTHFKYIKKWRASGYEYRMKFTLLERIQIAIGTRICNSYMTNA
jgi:glycosyltransferase involved in cell wall biosynthesis